MAILCIYMSYNRLRQDPINGVQKNLQEQAEEQEQKEEMKQEMQKDKTENSNTERYEVETKCVNTNGSGEGSCHSAEHLVTDTQNNVTVEVKERNAFDFGYSVHIFSKIDSIEDDEWVDVAVEVTEVKDSDVDSIAQKFEVKNSLNSFPHSEDDDTIDVVIWNESQTIDVEDGDTLILSSVVGNTFDDEVYLSVNSNTEIAQFTDIEELRKVAEDIDSFVRANNSIRKGVRM